MATDGVRQERLRLSERFLDEILLQGIENRSITTVEDVLELLTKFRQENAGIGDDFEIGHAFIFAQERYLATAFIKRAHDLLYEATFGKKPKKV